MCNATDLNGTDPGLTCAGAGAAGRVSLSDTVNCHLTPTPDFGVTWDHARRLIQTVIVNMWLVFSASAALDTVDAEDSCTSLSVPVTRNTDTSWCVLSPSTDFGLTPGSCQDID